MDMMGWFVLKRMPVSSVEKFEKELADRLDYVKDLERDEDGDWATEFIPADLNPNNVDTRFSNGLDYMKDLERDEDKDWATGFIPTDLNPNNVDTRRSNGLDYVKDLESDEDEDWDIGFIPADLNTNNVDTRWSNGLYCVEDLQGDEDEEWDTGYIPEDLNPNNVDTRFSNHLNYVKDLESYEDGDWATGFTPADLNPNNVDTRFSNGLDYVKDLERDEDEDWATGFIPKDLNPNNVDTRRSNGLDYMNDLERDEDEEWDTGYIPADLNPNNVDTRRSNGLDYVKDLERDEDEDRATGFIPSDLNPNNVETRRSNGLDYVKDLERDEDGSWDTGYIPTDLNPNNVDTRLSSEVPASSRSGVGSIRLYSDTEGPSNSHLDILRCNYCIEEVPIEDCVQLNCRCLLCKACIVPYVKSFLPHENKRIEVEAITRGFSCPVCSCEDSLSRLVAISLVPDMFNVAIMCPKCCAVIKKCPANAPPSGVPEINMVEAPLVAHDKKRMATNYIQCNYCDYEFCQACKAAPYHQGMSCTELEEEKHAAKCWYPELPISSTDSAAKVESRWKSIRHYWNKFKKAGLHPYRCTKKKDFLKIVQFQSSVSKPKECRRHVFQGHTQKLECSHHSGGISEEQLHQPYLEKKSQEGAMPQNKGKISPSRDHTCPICQSVPLGKDPLIQLQCGHIVHLHCANSKLEEGSRGPAITFDFLHCPSCPEIMRHYSLSPLLHRHLELLELVKEKAVNQLKMSINEEDKSIDPEYLANYVNIYLYYVCKICRMPYRGGTRDSRNNQKHPTNPICGGCIAARSGTCNRGHSRKFIKKKCWCCCSVGDCRHITDVLLCKRCYAHEQKYHEMRYKKCKGVECRPLGMPCGPHTRGMCLGCSMCYHIGQ